MNALRDGLADSFTDSEVAAADSVQKDSAGKLTESLRQIQNLRKRQRVG